MGQPPKASRRTAWLARALLLATPFLFLALAEVAVRVAGLEPAPWPVLGQGPDANFDGIEVDPLLGPLPRPGWRGRWFGRFPVEIDGEGFRATGLVPPRGAEEVAILGDSCTFGWEVDTRETYPARLDAIQRESG